MSISNVLAVVSLVIAITTIAYTRRQIAEARRAIAVDALLPFFEAWHAPELKRIRKRIYDPGVPDNPTEAEEEDLRSIIDRLELLGTLVENRLVDLTIVQSMFWHSPTKVWVQVSPFIDEQRAQGSEHYALNFEKLVDKYDPQLRQSMDRSSAVARPAVNSA